MADGQLIKIGDDGRVFVLLHADCRISKKRILALLQEAGIEETDVTFLALAEIDECPDLGHAVVLIPIDAAVCHSPELEDAGRHCGQAGGRVVVLFDSDFPYEGLHPLAEKYGTQCGWSASQLGPCLLGSEPTEPRTATGKPAIRPRAGPVKC